MLDDILFEFLHMEVVHSLVGQPAVISLPGEEGVSDRRPVCVSV